MVEKSGAGQSGVITTFAGTNPSKATFFGGYNGDGRSARSAWLHQPAGIWTTSNSLYIADAGNSRVRLVNPNGIIPTVAGNGTSGYLGDGGAATSAELVKPTGVTLDASGNLYITDQGINNSNSDVRRITTAGVISTYAGGTGVGADGDGGPATKAHLDVPKNLTVDSQGNVYIADTSNFTVREVAASTGNINTIAGTGSQGFSGDGGSARNATMNLPYSVAVDSSFNIYIADYQNACIRLVH